MKRLAAFLTVYAGASGFLASACWSSAAQGKPTPALVLGVGSGFILAFAVAHITAIVDTITRRRSS